MAWVRYDDNFYSNPKVTRVVGEDPGALALHLLANTWTNAQKHPGFVPAHQPAILLCDRQRAADWAPVLVRAGLWHERDNLCAKCAEEYVDLPADAVGYVFHNAKEYRAPARERTTPGVSTELSEKRREAGRKGGRISADRRKQDEAKQEQAKEATQASASVAQASGQANREQTQERAAIAGQANSAVQPTGSNAAKPLPAQTGMNGGGFAGVSKPSNLLLAGVSPVPEPVPEPTEEHPADVLFGEHKAASAVGKRSRRRTPREETRISEDFTPDPRLIEWAGESVPLVDVDRETPRFVDYWLAATKNEVKKDWNAAWRTWMRNAQERAEQNGRSLSAQQPRQPGLPARYEPRGGAVHSDRQYPQRQSSESRNAEGWRGIGDQIRAAMANGETP